jgi:predicted nucleic acid-binding protein
VLWALEDGRFTVIISDYILAEIQEVLTRPRFSNKLANANDSPR